MTAWKVTLPSGDDDTAYCTVAEVSPAGGSAASTGAAASNHSGESMALMLARTSDANRRTDRLRRDGILRADGQEIVVERVDLLVDLLRKSEPERDAGSIWVA